MRSILVCDISSIISITESDLLRWLDVYWRVEEVCGGGGEGGRGEFKLCRPEAGDPGRLFCAALLLLGQTFLHRPAGRARLSGSTFLLQRRTFFTEGGGGPHIWNGNWDERRLWGVRRTDVAVWCDWWSLVPSQGTEAGVRQGHCTHHLTIRDSLPFNHLTILLFHRLNMSPSPYLFI